METVTTSAPSQEAVHPALVKPLADADVPVLRDAYFSAMEWDATTGEVSKARATALGLEALLATPTK